MNVAVTGASGMTGGAVVSTLARKGHRVRAVVRGAVIVDHADETVRADSADLDALGRALLGVDAIVHVAGIRFGETLAGVPALRDARRVVVVSTAGIYSAHRSSAALYERNEQSLRSVRPDIAFVRPTMIYGTARDRNFHHVIRFARRWRLLPIPGDGASLIQPIHYLDLAAAIAALCERTDGGVVDAGGGAPLTLREAATQVLNALRQPVRLIHVPIAPARTIARVFDAMRGTRWAERVERTLEDRSVDNTRLIAVMGVHPRGFGEGVRDEVREILGR